jgi:hypothetical protein
MSQSQDEIQGQESSGQKHRMSIALTIGATIGAIGLILVLYGLFGHADYSRSDGINVNLWWGLVMTVFGLLMSIVGYISSRRKEY